MTLIRRLLAVATPRAGWVAVYHDLASDHLKYRKPSGAVVDLEAAGGGSGDVVGPSASVASEVALYDGTTGKLLKRAAISGLAKLASGVLSAAVAGTDYAPSAGVSGGQTILGDTSAGGTLTLRGSSGGGVVNVPDAMGLRVGNRPVATWLMEVIQPQVSGGTPGQIGIGVGIANSITGGTDAADSTGPWQGVPITGSARKHLRGQGRVSSPCVVECVLKTPSDLTNCNIYVGASSASAWSVGTTPANNSAGVCYRASTDASNWEAWSRDGSTTNNAGDVAPIAASTVYVLRLRYDGTSWYASIAGSAEVALSSNLPTGDLGIVMELQVSSGTRTFYWAALGRSFSWPA